MYMNKSYLQAKGTKSILFLKLRKEQNGLSTPWLAKMMTKYSK